MKSSIQSASYVRNMSLALNELSSAVSNLANFCKTTDFIACLTTIGNSVRLDKEYDLCERKKTQRIIILQMPTRYFKYCGSEIKTSTTYMGVGSAGKLGNQTISAPESSLQVTISNIV